MGWTDPLARVGALRLHLAPLGPRARQRILAAAGGGPAALAEPDLAVLDGHGLPPEAVATLRAVSLDEAESAPGRAAELGLQLAFAGDASWPALFRCMPDPPLVLWVRGELPPADAVAVAVVGSRRPTSYGLSRARRLAGELARAGAVVVSGGARGIDGVAHRAALEAAAPTVAVLGCGADVDYPREHAGLFEAVAAGGAVVSELPPGTAPRPAHFPARNRLLAGWAVGVLVVEAAARSGTLITARLALEQDRLVFAVPGPVTSELSAGTHALLRDGAVLVRDADDVLAELPPGLVPAPPPRREPGGAGDVVLAALPEGADADLDELQDRTGLEAGQVLARLGALEAAGRVERRPGGRWMRA